MQENKLLRLRIDDLILQNEGLGGKNLILEKMDIEYKMKERQLIQNYEDQISDFKDRLEKKETYLQLKEAKWLNIELILRDYLASDEELRDKFRDLKFSLVYQRKISNYVI
jgi:GrpB-like predicted nucleotidyltransferase (UPF0157 family)